MFRRACFLLSFAATIVGGFFVFSNLTEAIIISQNVIPMNEGTADPNDGWTYDHITTTTAGYLILKFNDSAATSPALDLTGYSSAELNFQIRTYGGVKTSTIEGIDVSSSRALIMISSDNGSSWQEFTTIEATTSELTAITPAIGLDNHISQTVLLKFTAPYATSSKGIGIDNISITGSMATNDPPIARAGADQDVVLGDENYFDASGSTDADGSISDYFWQFGDGATSTGITTTHTYMATGTYDVLLTVTDDGGATSSDSLIVTVIENDSSTPETGDDDETEPITTSTPEYRALPGDIVINEFLPSPTEGKEWIELYNRSSEKIGLSGWTVSDASSPVAISGSIEAGGFFVVEFNSGKLNNSGDLIIIRDASSTVIHQLAYGDYGGTAAPDKDDSIALARDGDLSSGYKETVTPTKGIANQITPKPQPVRSSAATKAVTPEKTTTSTEATSTEATTTPKVAFATGIIISEVLPNPAADEKLFEFIELQNAGTSTADLVGWILADKTGKKFKLPTSTPEVMPGGFLTIYRASSSIALNNSGEEEVLLYQPDGTLVDQASYLGPAKKDYSWSRSGDGEFYWTSVPTPGKNNSFPIEDDGTGQLTAVKPKSTAAKKTTSKPAATTVQTSLQAAKGLAVGQKAVLEGTVAVLPGILGAQIFYIVDGGAGIQVYCNKKDFPVLAIGDRIKASGEISQASGEQRLKISVAKDITVLNHGQPPEPTGIANSRAAEMSGALVKTKGTVLQVKGSYLYVDDGEDELRVYLKPSTGLSAKDLNLKEGDVVEISGIISMSASGPRLLPRSADDITKTGEVKSAYEEADAEPLTDPSRPADNNRYFWIIIAFLAAIIVIMAVKKSPAVPS